MTKVKKGLGITTDYQDEVLQIYIDSAKAFMKSSGVPVSVLNSDEAVGCILLIVNDSWNYGSGAVKISPLAEMRLIQLATKEGGTDVST